MKTEEVYRFDRIVPLPQPPDQYIEMRCGIICGNNNRVHSNLAANNYISKFLGMNGWIRYYLNDPSNPNTISTIYRDSDNAVSGKEKKAKA